MQNSLEVALENVEHRLGDRTFRFDCALPEGEIIAITGPSGSGKTTLLNLIAGFETPERGRVRIGGQDLTEVHVSDRPVSVVFQENNLFTHLDLFTNIGLGIRPRMRLTPEEKDAIGQALAHVGLAGFEKRMPGTLSGGERQRAAFARALVRKRPVLLLDEPFASLDPGLRADMASLLIDLRAKAPITILIVSHDADEVRKVATHAVFIEKGTIAVAAPMKNFLKVKDVPSLTDFLYG